MTPCWCLKGMKMKIYRSGFEELFDEDGLNDGLYGELYNKLVDEYNKFEEKGKYLSVVAHGKFDAEQQMYLSDNDWANYSADTIRKNTEFGLAEKEFANDVDEIMHMLDSENGINETNVIINGYMNNYKIGQNKGLRPEQIEAQKHLAAKDVKLLKSYLSILTAQQSLDSLSPYYLSHSGMIDYNPTVLVDAVKIMVAEKYPIKDIVELQDFPSVNKKEVNQILNKATEITPA